MIPEFDFGEITELRFSDIEKEAVGVPDIRKHRVIGHVRFFAGESVSYTHLRAHET